MNHFIERRKHLINIVEDDLIVLFGNHYLQKSGSTSFPFVQDSSFYYFTGIDEPGWTLVVDLVKREEWLIAPVRSDTLNVFEGESDAEGVVKTCGIETILDERKGWKKLVDRVIHTNSLATLLPPPTYVGRMQLYTNPMRKHQLDRLKRRASKVNFDDITYQVRLLRAKKDTYEITQIKNAIKITNTAFTKIKQELHNFKSENEVEAEITRIFRNQNAHHAYDPIVAADNNATTLHYSANNMKLNGNLLLIDVGAEVNHYCADITRTYAYQQPTQRQRDVFSAVEGVFSYAMTQLRPGLTMREFETKVEDYMGDTLIKLGLIKSKLSKNVRQYYPHATSHFLGLDVHDFGDYENPLQPDTVLTVEPGIYIPEERLGIRIEDDVIITESGVSNLSSKIPRDLN